jgi:signal transduction histidine kinase/DNA-binding response OmpR family regulator
MEKILVVDDEIGIVQLCKRVLESDEIKVETATDGEKALELISREGEAYDLVMSDLKMLGISGLDLLKKIKQINPQTPVILITGQATIESAVEALKYGAYDYLRKPFDLDDLKSSVYKCLEHNRLRRESNILSETLYLYQLSQEADKTRSELDLLDFVLERSVKSLNANTGSLFIFNQRRNTLQMISSSGMKESLNFELKLGEQVVGWVAQQKKPLLINGGVNKLPQFKDMSVRKDIASSMVVPIQNQHTLLGVICLNRYFEKSNYTFTAHDLESLQIFALHSALVLTSMRHEQAQKEVDELKSEFVSNVSHEVRTPLMAITGAVELLNGLASDVTRDPKVRMFLDLIMRNTERMRFLVNDLLDFSRLETGILKMYYGNVNLKVVIEEVLQDLSFKDKERNILFETDFPEDERDIIADREKIKQVIVNLVGNAVKFSPDGGIVKTGFHFKDEGHVSIVVANSGAGIPKDKQEKIFDKFYQVDGSASREKPGFGLGLAICKSIVEHHNGKIWVESEEGNGATFIVRIPIAGSNKK